MTPDDQRLLKEYRLKRMQRAVEYTLMTAIFLFFLISFFNLYRLLFAIVLFLLFFGMNLQLTMLREKRRATLAQRKRLVADTSESLLFLGLILLFSFPSITASTLGSTPEEHYALIASLLCGIFVGGLAGEVRFQTRRLSRYDGIEQVRYMEELRRSIILPYMKRRGEGG